MISTASGDSGNQTSKSGPSSQGSGNRNNVRGRLRQTGNILVTKPEGIVTKKGKFFFCCNMLKLIK